MILVSRNKKKILANIDRLMRLNPDKKIEILYLREIKTCIRGVYYKAKIEAITKRVSH